MHIYIAPLSEKRLRDATYLEKQNPNLREWFQSLMKYSHGNGEMLKSGIVSKSTLLHKNKVVRIPMFIQNKEIINIKYTTLTM